MTVTACNLLPILTEGDYHAAIENGFDHQPEPDGEAAAHFDALLTLIEAGEPSST